jgi:Trk K+ transport system NAD-binding subunit
VKSRGYKLFVRLRLALRQNRLPLVFVAAWLAANLVLFVRFFHFEPLHAVLVTTCIEKSAGGWPGAYQSFTEVVVFGLVASVVVTNVTRKYRPEETSRAIATQASAHIVVIGWTNLGQRVWELAAGAGKLAVVVEENAALVAPLVREEDPVVIGSPRERAVLEAASVASAHVVVIATDDLESAAVACRIVRELNARCEIVVRCADDDVGAVLARTYRARALSTSRMAASFIQGHATKLRAKTAVVFGMNNVGQRAAEALREKHIAVVHAEATSEPTEIALAGVGQADLVVLCDDDLGDNLIRVDRIRDVNKRTRIICRAFHEDAAEILTRAPFDCIVLSTSRHAADALARAGVFREVGIDQPDVRPKRALATA